MCQSVVFLALAWGQTYHGYVIGDIAQRKVANAHTECEDEEDQGPKVTAGLELVSSEGKYFDKVGKYVTLQWVRSCTATHCQQVDFIQGCFSTREY